MTATAKIGMIGIVARIVIRAGEKGTLLIVMDMTSHDYIKTYITEIAL